MDKPRVSNEELEREARRAENTLEGKFHIKSWPVFSRYALDLRDARRRIAELEARYKWRPVQQAHEDHGPCVYIDIQDPGSQLIAHVCNKNYAEDIEGMTHFSQLPELTQEMVEDLIAAQRQKEGE